MPETPTKTVLEFVRRWYRCGHCSGETPCAPEHALDVDRMAAEIIAMLDATEVRT